MTNPPDSGREVERVGQRMLKVFAVVGRAQADDARAVARHLEDAVAIDLASTSPQAVSAGRVEPSSIHVPKATIAIGVRLVAVLERLYRRQGRFVLISGQDVGTLQRVALTWARRRGLPTALMPDGIVFEVDSQSGVSTSTLGRLRAAADRAGVLLGDPVGLGRTNPDLILSWGVGWEELWRVRAPSARIAVTGSPRADALRALNGRAREGTRVLLCSQPLWQMEIGAHDDEIRRWYRWLADSAARLQPHVNVRIRLHPAEQDAVDEFADAAAIRRFVKHEPVDSALEWSSHVVAPASTISLEGAALGRRVALVAAARPIRSKWAASPVFADRGWSRLDLDRPLDVDSLDFRSIATERYFANVGRAASVAATTLVEEFG
jgi:hypothetical protein